MNTILLSIGSNRFAKTNIDKAKRMLTRLFPGMIFTPPILTEPDDEKYSFLFRNVLAKVETGLMPEEIIEKIKQTERAVGRSPRDKYLGKVIIDIDLIKYNDEILRPEDYQREYVQQLLSAFDETPSPDTVSSGKPTEKSSTEETPVMETPKEENSTIETPTVEIPTKDNPTEDNPTEETPTEETPTKIRIS